MQFIFDPSKDELNVRKHGISLDQASVVFNHPNKITLTSVREGEDRLVDITLVVDFPRNCRQTQASI